MEFHTIEEIFESIENSRRKIVKTVENLSDEHANFQNAPEKWTIAHIVEHLAKTENGILRMIEKLLGKAEVENVSPPERIEPPISFVKIVETLGKSKFEAPDALQPQGKRTIAESLGELAESRRKLRELRPRLEAVDLSNVKFPHPFFGALNLYYWLAFIGLHELHHLKQILEALKNHEQSLTDANAV